MDDRNQLDMFRALPGGLGGVARFVAALRARGVSVLFPYAYLAWDTGTRREGAEGVRDEEAVVALLRREAFTLFVRCCDKIHQRALCDCA